MANPSNFQTTRYYGPQVENTKFDFHNLYLHQIFSGPNPTQEKIVDGNSASHFGETAVNNWEIYDGVGTGAKLVARAQGMHMNASSWYTSFNMVFVDGRFKGSTLQIMGASIDEESEWAIVGGTGEFAFARGVVDKKVHANINGGQIQELTISGICLMKSNQPIVTKIGPWGKQGKRAHDIDDKPERLLSVRVRHGDVLDGIAFSYINTSGHTRTTDLFGFGGGSETTINLGPSEYVMQVSGTTNVQGEISSLTLVTNLKPYGPFGKPAGTSFSAPVPANSRVVGFFGSSGASFPCMNSIGVYLVS
uniref:Uncharacterized protein n=1 Tax=Avena sativa TaxID=4498 RepID=A0ACD5YZD5_AVESA